MRSCWLVIVIRRALGDMARCRVRLRVASASGLVHGRLGASSGAVAVRRAVIVLLPRIVAFALHGPTFAVASVLLISLRGTTRPTLLRIARSALALTLSLPFPLTPALTLTLLMLIT